MKLTHNCPKCGKPAKIQAEIPVGNMVNYVYQCGHLELKVKEITNDDNNVVSEDSTDITSVQSGIISHSSAEAGQTTGVAKLLTYEEFSKEFKVPEPTHKELYEDLDKWVSDGGAIKDTSAASPNPPYVPLSFYSVDMKECSYPYQIEGVGFAERAQLRCLIADAVGVGKTIEALMSVKRNPQIVLPCAYIVKGANAFQWSSEFRRWYSRNLADCIVVTTRNHLIQGFANYIISMDMLAKKDFVDILISLNLKCIVVDECQKFKDPSAKRTLGLIRLIKTSNIEYIIALSGTPIKNRAEEYFTILNIIAPRYFPSLAEFKRDWLVPVFECKAKCNPCSGKCGGKCKGYKLNPLRANKFHELISRWVIRREKHEVLKNLPDLTRDYQIIEIDDKNIKDSYNHTLDLFSNWLTSQVEGISSQALLGWLAQLRAITGRAKCKHAIEFTQDFMESTDESLAIGIHHKSVRDTLYLVCEQFGFNPLKFSGEDNQYTKNDVVRRFTNGDNRLLIINQVAGGEGLNLQTCANAVVLERQWSSADEEQFEARFHRNGQKKAVTVTYLIARGTIDEFFHDMVLRKRKILHETGFGSGVDLTSDINSLKDLANLVISHKI